MIVKVRISAEDEKRIIEYLDQEGVVYENERDAIKEFVQGQVDICVTYLGY